MITQIICSVLGLENHILNQEEYRETPGFFGTTREIIPLKDKIYKYHQTCDAIEFGLAGFYMGASITWLFLDTSNPSRGIDILIRQMGGGLLGGAIGAVAGLIHGTFTAERHIREINTV